MTLPLRTNSHLNKRSVNTCVKNIDLHMTDQSTNRKNLWPISRDIKFIPIRTAG